MGKPTSTNFITGFKSGMPIMLGYLPVSFAFSVWACNLGVPAWVVILISATNLTSAGQFAGTQMLAQQASLWAVGANVFIVNIRYMLMSFSLSQRFLKQPLNKRLLVANGITDEIFFFATRKKGELSGWFYTGLCVSPYIGWVGGTILGVLVGAYLPAKLATALGVAIFTMFIAIVIPPVRASKPAACTVVLSVGLSALFYYIKPLSAALSKWALILVAVIAASVMALCFPHEEEEGA